MSASPSILIAGGGIGGLTAALAALRAGREVVVLEQAAELGEVGAGLTLTPSASRALNSLGLGDGLAAVGSAPAAGEMRHYSTGAVLLELPQAPRSAAPLTHVHRADLHGMLQQAIAGLAPGCIRTRSRLTGLQQDADGVVVRLASGEEIRGSALIGADGVRSTVRRLCFGDPGVEFTGYVAWRGLVSTRDLMPGLMDPPLVMWLGPERLFIRYPLRDGSLCNYVAIAAQTRWAEEGWTVRSSVDELLGEFRECDPQITGIIGATPPGTLFRWGIFARRPLESWDAGRVTLLGDAAHAMPPFLGQGAVMAIEDGVVLGRALSLAMGAPEALSLYGQARVGRTTAVMRASWEIAPLYFGPEPAAGVRALGARMAALRESYRYDAARAL